MHLEESLTCSGEAGSGSLLENISEDAQGLVPASIVQAELERFKANNEKLKGGDIMRVSEVVRDLALRECDKGLSAGEKRMLSKARQVLVSELAAALDKSDEDAEAYLDDVLTA